VGKTTIAQQLAQHYKIHHIHIKDVVTQAVDNLNRLAKRAEQETEKHVEEGEEAEEEEEEEETPDLSDLEAINDQMENNNGKSDLKSVRTNKCFKIGKFIRKT
jgi:adenylate kinase